MADLEDEGGFGILDAERELIAAILADRRAYGAVAHLLQPAHFLSPQRGRQFAALADAITAGQPIDPALIGEAGPLDPGGPALDPLDHALMIYGSFLGREAIAPARPLRSVAL